MKKKFTVPIGVLTLTQFESLLEMRDALLECSNPLYNISHFSADVSDRELGFALGQVHSILITQHELLEDIIISIDPKRYEVNNF